MGLRPIDPGQHITLYDQEGAVLAAGVLQSSSNDSRICLEAAGGQPVGVDSALVASVSVVYNRKDVTFSRW